jgi:hypothetical protein
LRAQEPASRQEIEQQILTIKGASSMGQKEQREQWEKKYFVAGQRADDVDAVQACSAKNKQGCLGEEGFSGPP